MILAVGVVLFLVAIVLLGTYFLEPSTKTTTFKRVSVNEARNVASSQQKIKPQKSVAKKPKLTFKELLFKAGIVSDVELKKFYLISAISPVIGFGVGFLIGFLVGYSTIANGLGILGA
ncbi:MAG: hypothetical protein NZO16_02935, partial [Deltaproteobacteria bacterium]|nr:hypothetical protein [Deltaproteobacteria bacterium]